MKGLILGAALIALAPLASAETAGTGQRLSIRSVNLGLAGSYAILSKAGISATGVTAVSDVPLPSTTTSVAG